MWEILKPASTGDNGPADTLSIAANEVRNSDIDSCKDQISKVMSNRRLSTKERKIELGTIKDKYTKQGCLVAWQRAAQGVQKHFYQQGLKSTSEEGGLSEESEDWGNDSNLTKLQKYGEGVRGGISRQDHVQDDSGKELDKGDASKKRKTTGLNHSESGKSSEEKGPDVAESNKRKKMKGKDEMMKDTVKPRENWVSPRKFNAGGLNYKV